MSSFSNFIRNIDRFATKEHKEDHKSHLGGLLTICVPILLLIYASTLVAQSRSSTSQDLNILSLNLEDAYIDLFIYCHSYFEPGCNISYSGVETDNKCYLSLSEREIEPIMVSRKNMTFNETLNKIVTFPDQIITEELYPIIPSNLTEDIRLENGEMAVLSLCHDSNGNENMIPTIYMMGGIGARRSRILFAEGIRYNTSRSHFSNSQSGVAEIFGFRKVEGFVNGGSIQVFFSLTRTISKIEHFIEEFWNYQMSVPVQLDLTKRCWQKNLMGITCGGFEIFAPITLDSITIDYQYTTLGIMENIGGASALIVGFGTVIVTGYLTIIELKQFCEKHICKTNSRMKKVCCCCCCGLCIFGRMRCCSKQKINQCPSSNIDPEKNLSSSHINNKTISRETIFEPESPHTLSNISSTEKMSNQNTFTPQNIARNTQSPTSNIPRRISNISPATPASPNIHLNSSSSFISKTMSFSNEEASTALSKSLSISDKSKNKRIKRISRPNRAESLSGISRIRRHSMREKLKTIQTNKSEDTSNTNRRRIRRGYSVGQYPAK